MKSPRKLDFHKGNYVFLRKNQKNLKIEVYIWPLGNAFIYGGAARALSERNIGHYLRINDVSLRDSQMPNEQDNELINKAAQSRYRSARASIHQVRSGAKAFLARKRGRSRVMRRSGAANFR